MSSPSFSGQGDSLGEDAGGNPCGYITGYVGGEGGEHSENCRGRVKRWNLGFRRG